MSRADDQGLRKWLEQRSARWRQWAGLTRQLQRGGDHDPGDARELVLGYRSLARDISLARRTLPNSRLSRFVDALFLDLHTLLHKPAVRPVADLISLYRDEIPRLMGRLRTAVIATTLWFVATAAAGGWLVWQFPELASLTMSEQMIEHVQEGELWTDGILNIVPSSVLTISLFANNTAVALTAFALGVFYGLGTLYIIGLNGFMLGGVFAYTAHYSMADELFRFVIAHGIVELSVIVVAGAAGVLLGEALARPGDRSRSAAFQHAARQGLRLMAALVPFLLVCGLIEGYVSPNPSYALAACVFIGVAWAFVAWAVITGRVWRRRAT